MKLEITAADIAEANAARRDGKSQSKWCPAACACVRIFGFPVAVGLSSVVQSSGREYSASEGQRLALFDRDGPLRREINRWDDSWAFRPGTYNLSPLPLLCKLLKGRA